MNNNDDWRPPWWLGAGNSAFTPVDPRRGLSALTPVDPYASLAAAAPVDPYAHSAAATPVDPYKPRHAMPTPAPGPNADPSWVYSSGDALLAQAIRRSHAKVARPPDELLSRQEWQAAHKGKAVRGTNLWRWAPEFRVKTVAGHLLGRTLVQGRDILFLQTGTKGMLAVAAQPLFSLERMPSVDIQVQVDKVVRAAVEREDRMPEVLAQADGFWPFFERLLGFSLGSAPTLAELLAVGDAWCVPVLMMFKHELAWRRPVQESSLVLPVIQTPGHGSMPSGHATLAAFQAELLRTLLYPRDSLRSQQLDRLARRIAFNRVVAGVHFPVDNLVGYRLGTQLAQLFSAWADHEHALAPKALRARDIVTGDHTLKEDAADVPVRQDGAPIGLPIPTLKSLWQQSAAELKQLRG